MAGNTAEPRLHGGFRLLNIAGIQITIDPSWFLIFILVVFSLSAGYFPRQFPGQGRAAYWLAGGLATLLFFGSILVHELAHALMAMRAGIHTKTGLLRFLEIKQVLGQAGPKDSALFIP